VGEVAAAAANVVVVAAAAAAAVVVAVTAVVVAMVVVVVTVVKPLVITNVGSTSQTQTPRGGQIVELRYIFRNSLPPHIMLHSLQEVALLEGSGQSTMVTIATLVTPGGLLVVAVVVEMAGSASKAVYSMPSAVTAKPWPTASMTAAAASSEATLTLATVLPGDRLMPSRDVLATPASTNPWVRRVTKLDTLTIWL